MWSRWCGVTVCYDGAAKDGNDMDPFPNLERVMKVHAPAEVLVMDLDDPEVWTRPPIDPHRFTAGHWGGLLHAWLQPGR